MAVPFAVEAPFLDGCACHLTCTPAHARASCAHTYIHTCCCKDVRTAKFHSPATAASQSQTHCPAAGTKRSSSESRSFLQASARRASDSEMLQSHMKRQRPRRGATQYHTQRGSSQTSSHDSTHDMLVVELVDTGAP